MKCSKVAMLIAMTCALAASSALAQDHLRQPTSVRTTNSLDYGSYFQQDDVVPSPSDLPVAPEVAPIADDAADCGCVDGCARCGLFGFGTRPPIHCIDDEPWRLFPCFQDPCGPTINGFVAAGATANFDDPASRYNGPLSFNDRNELMLNQLYLVMEQAVDTGGHGWGIGGRVDVLWGSDARFTEARGLETRGDGSQKWNGHQIYGVALPQLYAEVGYDDLSVKLGHFYTIIGYEVVPATGNFFYSHAYTMQYGEPFTHTGLLATYQYSDTTTLVGGFDRGWDNWEGDPGNTIGFLGGLSWDGGDGLTVALTGTLGQEPIDDTDTVFSQRSLYSLVVSWEINDRWTYVFQHDNGRQKGGSGVTPGQDAEWYGINQYLFYRMNCCWTAGLRAEWFRDDDGARVAAVGARGLPTNPASVGGFQGDFYAITLGANWMPNPNLIVRPEIRFDWFEPGTGNINQPFNDLTSNNQQTVAVDVILRY